MYKYNNATRRDEKESEVVKRERAGHGAGREEV